MPFEIIVGKEEKYGIFDVPTMFSIISLILLGEILLHCCLQMLNFVAYKIFNFNKDLTISQPSPGFYLSAVQVF